MKQVQPAAGQTLAGTNPLAWALGQFIQKTRKARQITSSQLASELGLRASSYRLIEAGGAPLQPKYFRTLIESLADEGTIRWPRLAILFSAIRELEASKKSQDGLIEGLDVLANSESGLEELASILLKALRKNEPRAGNPRLETRVTSIIAKMLSTPLTTPAPDDIAASVWTLLRECDPFLLDQHLRVITELSALDATVSAAALGKWETMNASRIKEVNAVISPRTAISRDQLVSGFDWPFLRLDRQCVINIWPPADHSHVAAATAHITEAARERKLPSLLVRCVSDQEAEQLAQALDGIATPAKDHNFWAYTTQIAGAPAGLNVSSIAVYHHSSPSNDAPGLVASVTQSLECAKALKLLRS